MYKQGSVVIVKFPFTDGSEFKKRPALVISNSRLDTLEDGLLVQITSKFSNDGLRPSFEKLHQAPQNIYNS